MAFSLNPIKKTEAVLVTDFGLTFIASLGWICSLFVRFSIAKMIESQSFKGRFFVLVFFNIVSLIFLMLIQTSKSGFLIYTVLWLAMTLQFAMLQSINVVIIPTCMALFGQKHGSYVFNLAIFMQTFAILFTLFLSNRLYHWFGDSFVVCFVILLGF